MQYYVLLIHEIRSNTYMTIDLPVTIMSRHVCACSIPIGRTDTRMYLHRFMLNVHMYVYVSGLLKVRTRWIPRYCLFFSFFHRLSEIIIVIVIGTRG